MAGLPSLAAAQATCKVSSGPAAMAGPLDLPRSSASRVPTGGAGMA